MKCLRQNTRSRRSGLTVSELVIAMGVAVAAMVGVTQLMYQATRQNERAANRNLLALEAASVMEDLMSRPWKEITAESGPAVQLSQACLQAVPEAHLMLEIEPEEDQEDVRRITVSIEWGTLDERPAEPCHLVAWRYRLSH